MRIISQNGNFECDYEDLAFCITPDGQINGILSKVNKDWLLKQDIVLAEYDNNQDAHTELSMLRKRYVSLGNNPGSYQFSMAETYRKSRGEVW